jgi:neutral ceramidase
MSPFLKCIVLLGFSFHSALAAEWKVGIAAISITPEEPVHLLGYSTRGKPFESVDIDIYVKALAIEDAEGHRGVIMTSDLVGFQDAFSGAICDRIRQKTGLERSQLILNASHNHTGPLISLDPIRQGNLAHGNLSDEEAQRTIRYSELLQDKIVKLVERALADLRPAQLSWGSSAVGFVMNRRSGAPGAIHMDANPQGVVDRIVPVLKVSTPDGTLRCILFGCACHNTALTADHNIISGDYAGYAQAILQRKFTEVQAMFISGCGADANPEPRGSIEQAKHHGRELAEAVCRALDSDLASLRGPLRTAYKVVELPLKDLSRDDLAKYMVRGNAQAMMAEHMTHILESGGKLLDSYPAPVAIWSFGDGLTLVALPGEGVAGYVDLIRRRLKSRNLWVSSYNNDCFGYLPTSQIVQEGGHEAIGVTVWVWGNHLANKAGFFSAEVESTILDTVGELVGHLEATRQKSNE